MKEKAEIDKGGRINKQPMINHNYAVGDHRFVEYLA